MMTVFGYLILISIAFFALSAFLWLYFSVFSLVFVLIEKIMKHCIARHVFNPFSVFVNLVKHNHSCFKLCKWYFSQRNGQSEDFFTLNYQTNNRHKKLIVIGWEQCSSSVIPVQKVRDNMNFSMLMIIT